MKLINAFGLLILTLLIQENVANKTTQVRTTTPQPPSLGQKTLATIKSYYPFSQILGRAAGGGEILPNLLTALIGMASSGQVAPVIGPILIKYLLLPLLTVVKGVARSMLFFGTFSYLVSSMVPVALSYLGLIAGTGFVGRAQQSSSWILTPIQFANNRIASVTDGALNYLDMNSPQCKMMIACKVGQFMVKEYPGVTEYMKKYGITSVIETTAGNYTSALLKSMTKESDESCDSRLCPTYRSFEGYLYNAADLTNSLVETTTALPTTTTTTQKSIEMKAAATGLMELISRLSKDFDVGQLTSYLS